MRLDAVQTIPRFGSDNLERPGQDETLILQIPRESQDAVEILNRAKTAKSRAISHQQAAALKSAMKSLNARHYAGGDNVGVTGWQVLSVLHGLTEKARLDYAEVIRKYTQETLPAWEKKSWIKRKFSGKPAVPSDSRNPANKNFTGIPMGSVLEHFADHQKDSIYKALEALASHKLVRAWDEYYCSSRVRQHSQLWIEELGHIALQSPEAPENPFEFD
jgi:hypothetical protein